MTGANVREAREEVDASIRRLFFYAGFADKYDGAVHSTQKRFVTLAMNEPWGVMGLVCPDEAPLLAFVSLIAPAIAMGNAVVVAPSAGASARGDRFLFRARYVGCAGGRRQHRHGRSRRARQDARRTRRRRRASGTRGPAEGAKAVEVASAGNLKATWTLGAGLDWARRKGASSCGARPR